MIKLGHRDFSLIQIQWVSWVFVVFLTFTSHLITDYPLTARAIYSTINNVLCSAGIIYGNMLVLMPRFYRLNKIKAYVVVVVVFLSLICIYRVKFRTYMMHVFFPNEVDQSSVAQVYTVIAISCIMTFFLSFLLKLALDYFMVRKEQELLKQHTAEVELDLLKSQVQPHFLFNTLNNIYYVAQVQSPETAQLLAKLSNIMRYFVDEAPQKEIQLSTEIQFIRDYIDLEQMRLRYPMDIDIRIDGNIESVRMPPMLIIPLVENVFKHGIDKRSANNFLYLCLKVQDDQLRVEVSNRIADTHLSPSRRGGLENLTSRLTFLYGVKYRFDRIEQNNDFLINLTIPL